MKELQLHQENKIEISVKQQKEIKHELIGKIIPYNNHVIFEINNETLEIKKAKFSNTTYQFGGENKKEIVVKKGHTYIAALNKKNALKKFNSNKNGSKPINEDPLPLFTY